MLSSRRMQDPPLLLLLFFFFFFSSSSSSCLFIPAELKSKAMQGSLVYVSKAEGELLQWAPVWRASNKHPAILHRALLTEVIPTVRVEERRELTPQREEG
ncbi:unnamed protein product [Pleuronectes platessa]|uniref:Secreted protein n=1 Tax=Pleuronectes platessa TaxID=8262 RepID=A0A9N7YJ92_PLEPL|nr:unnamed protein product [Pleuronectes platessa]